MLAVMEAWLPWPTAVRAITEAMPITMPRTVSPERILLVEMAMTASSMNVDESSCGHSLGPAISREGCPRSVGRSR